MAKIASLLIISTLIFSLGAPITTQAMASDMLEPDVSNIYVSSTGQDQSGCGTTSAPCKTLQYGVNKTTTGGTVRVAAGIYTYSGSNPSSTCTYYSNTNAVACIENKKITILGGYSIDDWSYADPVRNPTIIDGQNSYRGVAILDTSANGNSASLDLEGFTIQNGRAKGLLNGDADHNGAYGAGFFSHIAPVTLRNITFLNNQAIGGDSTTSAAGSGVGGGLMLNRIGTASTSILDHLTFTNNLAKGGQGAVRGGSALGGGIFIYSSNFAATYLTFSNNIAQAGSSGGSGVDSTGATADGLGGGINIHSTSNATLQHVTANGNQAIGGNASNALGRGGLGAGGFLETEFVSSLTVLDSLIKDNLALGGSAHDGGSGSGGGIFVSDSSSSIKNSSMIANRSIGGNGGGGSIGSTGGGGFYVNWSSGQNVVNNSLVNCIIADNTINGGGGTGTDPVGGGGGLWLMGNSGTIVESTIVNNHMDSRLVYGIGIIIYHISGYPSTTANISYTAITDHTNSRSSWPRQSTVHVWNGSTSNLSYVAFSNNTLDTNINNEPGTAGGIGKINLNAPLNLSGSVGYIAPDAPYFNFHITSSSSLKDKGVSSTITDDIDGHPRPYNSVDDIGADEYEPFNITALPGANNIKVDWSAAELSKFNGINTYDVIVACVSGANPPDQGQCGKPIRQVGVMSMILTGLTGFKPYTITVQAIGSSGGSEASSIPIVATPYDLQSLINKIYLPSVIKIR